MKKSKKKKVVVEIKNLFDLSWWFEDTPGHGSDRHGSHGKKKLSN